MCPEIFNEENCIEPLVHINETNDRFVVMIDLPCVRKEDIELKASERSIEIDAIIKSIHQHNYRDKKTVKFTFFHKTISLHADIITEKVKAKFEKNILLITLSKAKKIKYLNID